MPRPRASRLDPERRQALLDVAAEEFAEHGFDGASYNRILERAGFSKGVAYYYFEGKDDLYAAVLALTLDTLARRFGAWQRPADADGFWRALRARYLALTTHIVDDERSARLLRSMSQARTHPKLQEAWLRFEGPLVAWFQRVLEDGRALGAVRGDVPESLLLTSLMGIGQATDGWLLEQWAHAGAPALQRGAEQVFALFEDLLVPRPVGPPPAKRR
ncbi:TetR/AcrR family transcriptional regulator [Myxococcus sp. SDU36]|uniref:TetR/AcrR family transcriptional regulator n=1 Tax=Myxococcus sp. SDU36 TaxID=2831967 RepID=UPI0025429939|nr:TetR/AcrR family transcriptional regulator [Myxococcus sp. SDU36]WIG97020.1 TetR/AcrR family transcriptional regulator [Myxococcus sp. SDU36]